MTVWLAIIINSVLFLILSIISGYWTCYFIKRVYSLKRYKRREVSCISGYEKEQLHYNFETAIWKCTLLLLIIACEIISCFFSLALDTYRRFLTLHNVTNTTMELPYSECISYNKPAALNKVSLFDTEIPYIYGFSTIAKSLQILVLALTIHLMYYLISRIKSIKVMNSRRFFLLTVLLCMVYMIAGFIQYLSILSIIFFLILGIVYLCVFLRTSEYFKRALLQRAMECLIQHRSNKSEMIQYTYSKVSINILRCGYLLLFISEIIIGIADLSVSILIFGNCYFPSNLFPSLSYVLQTEEEIRTFLEVFEYVVWIGYAITYTAIFVIWFPMLCITIYHLIKPIRERFHCTRNIKYRFSESSLKDLLVYD